MWWGWKLGVEWLSDKIQIQRSTRREWLRSEKQSEHGERPQGEQAQMKHDKIRHPGNVLLTGKWWEGWGWWAQMIVPTPSSQPWQRFHLLHIDMGMGTEVPPAPACPGSARTPTLWEQTPKLLQSCTEAEAQAACLTPVHLSTSTPVGISVTLLCTSPLIL